MYENIAVIGSGAIGSALLQRLAELYASAKIYSFSSKGDCQIHGNIIPYQIDYTSEDSIAHAASRISQEISLDLIIVATGLLHDKGLMPEKSLRDVSHDKFQKLFTANTILPALIAKHFLPRLRKDKRAIFAAISARIGSISDNKLGGWYAYRASKAALNMIIKNIAIETARLHSEAIIVGLHPGTVDSPLSKPFQGSARKLFTPDESAEYLINVLNNLNPASSGKCFAWDGSEIEY